MGRCQVFQSILVIIGVPDEEKGQGKKILKEIMAKNFPRFNENKTEHLLIDPGISMNSKWDKHREPHLDTLLSTC